MKNKLFWICVLTLFVVNIIALSYAGDNKKNQVPNIEGTYKVLYRKLPDGTIQSPPDIMGLITFTKEQRNFNIMWKDDKGNVLSLSYIASYKLTATEYSETSQYFMVNDQISGKGVSYDFSGLTGTAPVKIDDDGVHIDFPLYDEPKLIFKGSKIVATGPGFVDYWEKVDITYTKKY